MRLKRLLAVLALCLAIPAVAAASENSEKATQLFDQGLVVLAKGDFDGALKAFTSAAKTDPENQNYRQHVALVHRVKQVRASLDKATEKQEWAMIAMSLRSFYSDYGIYEEALALDKQRHAKLCTKDTAVDLAETQLELNLNADAVKVLSSLGPKKASARSKVLLGIGLARNGEVDRAKDLAKRWGKPVVDDTQLIYEAACLNALVGKKKIAAEQLTAVFEKTPPGKLPSLKDYSKRRKDLVALQSAEFAQVWLVASKVKPGCAGCSSGGAGCDMEKGDAGCDMEGGSGCGSDCESGGTDKSGDCCDKEGGAG